MPSSSANSSSRGPGARAAREAARAISRSPAAKTCLPSIGSCSHLSACRQDLLIMGLVFDCVVHASRGCQMEVLTAAFHKTAKMLTAAAHLPLQAESFLVTATRALLAACYHDTARCIVR